jgi:glycosyltransferase EpsF
MTKLPPYRVLQVVPTLTQNGGVAQMMWRHYRALDHDRVQFDFVAHGPPDPFHDEIRRLGGRVFCIETLGALGVFRYVQTMGGLIRRHGPYAAVHIHTNYQSGVVGLAAWQAGVPKRICHIRGVHIDRRNQRLLPFYRFLIRLTCNVRLACNQEAGQHYYGRQPFTVIPNAVYLKEFEQARSGAMAMRQQLGLNGYAMVLGHVGRFTAEKNHGFLVEVCRVLREAGINVGLVLAGDGPLRADMERLVQARGISQYVHFLGVRKDIPRVMAAFDVLLLPSLSEGLPNAVVEAQASGIPALISDGLTREVDLGLNLVSFAPISSVSAWTERLPALGQASRLDPCRIRERFVSAGFTVEQNVGRLTELYESKAAP